MLEHGRLRRRPRRHDDPPLAHRASRGAPAWPSPTSTSPSPGRTRPRLGGSVQGINAGDAMVIAQVAIGMLRQQFRPGDQVHGMATERWAGGQHHPDSVTGRFMCRSTSLAGLGDSGAPGRGLLRGRGAGHRGVLRPHRPGPGLLAHGERPGSARALPGQRRGARAELLPRRPAGPPAHLLHRHGQRVAGRSHHPPAGAPSSPADRSTTSPSSPPPASPRRPTPPCATARSPWPGRLSTPPSRANCEIACWLATRPSGSGQRSSSPMRGRRTRSGLPDLVSPGWTFSNRLTRLTVLATLRLTALAPPNRRSR